MSQHIQDTFSQEEKNALVEGQGSPFDCGKKSSWSNPACWFKYLRYVNFISLFAFTVAFLIMHTLHVRKGQVCSAYDTPSSCWSTGGDFKAINFTVLTTRLAYQAEMVTTGAVKVTDNSMRTQSVNAFPVMFYPDAATTAHMASNCPRLTNASASYGTSDGPRSRRRCDAELMNQMYQIPNSRTDHSLSGGLHTYFMFFVGLHIATAFAGILLPDTPQETKTETEVSMSGQMEWIKALFIFGWYVFGLIAIIMIYADSDTNNLRVPVNNVILSIIIEVFAMIITFVWVFTDLHPYCMAEIHLLMLDHRSRDDQAVVQGEIVHSMETDDQDVNGSQHGMASKLSSLMRIQAPHAPLMTPMANPVMSPWQKHAPGYTPLGIRTTHRNTYRHDGKTIKSNKFDLSVFDVKLLTGEIIEPFLVECALTMPIILAVAYCIGHQNTYDFVIQSIFSRTFLGFAILAVCVKIFGIWHCGERKNQMRDEQSKVNYVDAAAGSVCIIAAFSVLIMFGFMLYTWFEPLRVVAVENHHLGHMPYAHSFVLVVLIFTMIIIAILVGTVMLNSICLVFYMHVAAIDLNMGILFTVTFLLWTLRLIMFIYMCSPDWLLGAFDSKDVIFGYPY